MQGIAVTCKGSRFENCQVRRLATPQSPFSRIFSWLLWQIFVCEPLRHNRPRSIHNPFLDLNATRFSIPQSLSLVTVENVGSYLQSSAPLRIDCLIVASGVCMASLACLIITELN